MQHLLEVKDLTVSFKQNKNYIKAVNNVTFSVKYGQSLGIVGESGSGKSVTSLAAMGLLPHGTKIEGSIFFKEKNLFSIPQDQWRKNRGAHISMVFQEPMNSLNPLHKCGKQIVEPILLHEKNISVKSANERGLELLHLTGIPAPKQRFNEYPHQMSGGMRQRVMIAMALACNPSLLIADEPTTALDVTIQAQILELMKNLKNKLNMSIIMITHDLGLLNEMCDNVLVMYTGNIVEESPIDKIFSDPLHPYTVGLLNAIPQMEKHTTRLSAIEGMVPNPANMPGGCSFHPRCKDVFEKCKNETPQLYNVGDERKVRCFKYS